MVMAERSCWRSGTDKRGWAVRSGTARGELAVSDTAEPTAEAWAFAGGQTTSIAAGIPTVLRSGCFRGLIAYSFLFIPSLSRSLYATDLFTRSEFTEWEKHVRGLGRKEGTNRPADGGLVPSFLPGRQGEKLEAENEGRGLVPSFLPSRQGDDEEGEGEGGEVRGEEG